MPLWVNSDGLAVLSGRDEVGQGLLGPTGRGGSVFPRGPLHVYEFIIGAEDFSLAVYPTLGATKILSESTTVPNGFRIDSAEFFVETAFAGATATLDVGLIQQDRTTAINLAGILSGIAVASLTAGARIAGNGTSIGTANLTAAGLIMARDNTARFTAGRGTLRLLAYNPLG
jgi:hypothetical protein